MSNSTKVVPKNLANRVEIYSGSIPDLIYNLKNKGYQHAYIDGGKVITSFLNLQLIDELTLTVAPILLGSGIPLFGKMFHNVYLENAKATAFPNNFIEIKYKVKYP